MADKNKIQKCEMSLNDEIEHLKIQIQTSNEKHQRSVSDLHKEITELNDRIKELKRKHSEKEKKYEEQIRDLESMLLSEQNENETLKARIHALKFHT